ncbi:MAG: hypothetical protein QM519_00420 [Bacteroidia bacterium]|nr:hypothetical protein [Bacteroidia bacterium]
MMVMSAIVAGVVLSLPLAAQDAAVPPPDESNAATWYRRAGEIRFSEEDQLFIGTELFDHNEWRMWDPAWVARAERMIQALGPTIDALARGAAADRCDFELDRSAGLGMLLPHLAQQRHGARVLGAAAQWAMNRGDVQEAARLVTMQTELARDLVGDRVMISSLVSASIGSISTTHARDLLDLGLLDPATAANLAGTFEAMADPAALGCAEAMRGEMELMRASLKDAESAKEALAMADPQTPVEIADDEAVKRELGVMDDFYLRAAAAFEEPDPAKGRAILDGLTKELESLPDGSLARTLMPSWDRMWESMQALRKELAAVAGQFRAIADGKASSEFADAMVWYAQAGRAIAAIRKDEQIALELLRSIGHAEDAKRVLRPLEQQARLVDQAMQRGWAAGRCEVAGREFIRPTLAVDHVALARGAARAVLLRAQQVQDVDLARAVQGCVRMVAQARDSGCLAGALLASLLLDDLTESMPAILADPRIDRAARTSLAESLASLLDGGLRLPAALRGDVDAIVRRWAPPRQAPELAAARTAAGQRLGANGVAYVLAVMSPTVTREADHLPMGELVDDGGVAIDALEQLAEERDAVGATLFVSGTEAATVETMPPLGNITPKVPIDLEAMATSWTDRVQALITSVRGG